MFYIRDVPWHGLGVNVEEVLLSGVETRWP